MEGRGLKYFLILLLSLTSISAIQPLCSINDLRNIDFGHTFPRHGLLLLHWFANNINIDNNDIPLNFEPNRGDYGIHYYRNHDNLLHPLSDPSGTVVYSYYTLGNLNLHNNNARAFPSYVTQGFYNSVRDQNRDRIIIRVREDRRRESSNPRTIDRVYITQHYGHYGLPQGRRSQYDPHNTFQISPALLREIRELPVRPTVGDLQNRFGQNLDQCILDQLYEWGYLITLGLLLFVVTGNESTQRFRKSIFSVFFLAPGGAGATGVGDQVDNAAELLRMQLKVKTSKRRHAKICWDYIPEKLLKQGVMVVLFKNNTETRPMHYCSVRNSASGSFDTRVDLNPGLQVRLHKALSHWLFSPTVGELIWRGPEFHDANGEVPRYVSGFEEASLQLFVQNGTACARLYIRKTFTDWKVKFYNSWVGFYSTETKKTSDYTTWQWVTKFTRENRTDWEDIPDYDVYVYHSNMDIAPGVQARFILKKSKTSEAIAYTPDWESAR